MEFFPYLFDTKELTSFVTHDVTDSEKTILRELLFEEVQLKDESHSQYCFPGSEIFSTFFLSHSQHKENGLWVR